MDSELDVLLKKLEQRGMENDSAETVRKKKYLNITRDTGEFLAVMVKATGSKRILEIGTSNGYSTLWLASSVPAGGHVVTLEIIDEKVAEAKENFAVAGLGDKIDIQNIKADRFFETPMEPFDLIFLDAERHEYMGFAARLYDALKPGGVMICDNAISHAAELDEFMKYTNSRSDLVTCLLPVGKGELVACKEAAPV